MSLFVLLRNTIQDKENFDNSCTKPEDFFIFRNRKTSRFPFCHKYVRVSYRIIDEYRYFSPNTSFTLCLPDSTRFLFSVVPSVSTSKEPPLYSTQLQFKPIKKGANRSTRTRFPKYELCRHSQNRLWC